MKASGKIIARFLVLPLGLALTYLYTQPKAEPFLFYKDSMHGRDVWRLPLIKPHELITADCFKACNGWSYQVASLARKQFVPDSINLQGRYILFHSEGGHGYGF